MNFVNFNVVVPISYRVFKINCCSSRIILWTPCNLKLVKNRDLCRKFSKNSKKYIFTFVINFYGNKCDINICFLRSEISFILEVSTGLSGSSPSSLKCREVSLTSLNLPFAMSNEADTANTCSMKYVSCSYIHKKCYSRIH